MAAALHEFGERVDRIQVLDVGAVQGAADLIALLTRGSQQASDSRRSSAIVARAHPPHSSAQS